MYLNWKFCNWNASNLLKWWKRYIGLFTFSLSISEVLWSLFLVKNVQVSIRWRKQSSERSELKHVSQSCQISVVKVEKMTKMKQKDNPPLYFFFLNKNIFLWIEWQKYHEIVVRSFSWLFLCRYMRLGDNNKKYLSRSTMASLSKEEEKTFDFSS